MERNCILPNDYFQPASINKILRSFVQIMLRSPSMGSSSAAHVSETTAVPLVIHCLEIAAELQSGLSQAIIFYRYSAVLTATTQYFKPGILNW